MNSDILKVAAILALPVLAPPIIQYKYDISAPLVLGAIIACYLPLWYRLNYQKRESNE